MRTVPCPLRVYIRLYSSIRIYFVSLYILLNVKTKIVFQLSVSLTLYNFGFFFFFFRSFDKTLARFFIRNQENALLAKWNSNSPTAHLNRRAYTASRKSVNFDKKLFWLVLRKFPGVLSAYRMISVTLYHVALYATVFPDLETHSAKSSHNWIWWI